MDIYSLVAGTPREPSRQQPMSARDEQLYYERAGLPRLPRGLTTSLATLAGAMLMLLVGGYVF
ncbi:hypothetical protein VW23_015215 [Devosia insulae DS-56]|uniref:Uncharacterized protein n=1 Tax=Devosia insulae DS-56 TaxID=1116389 RepID=A0A1E5XSV1_9HYPH|nr:hypothetical protein [Devosia insulae]OEO31635.1 hypothetical protein VW23_015215 [Devosia insulae DS-56]